MDFVLATPDHPTAAAAAALPEGLFSESAPAPWAVVASDGGFEVPMSGSKSSNDEAEHSGLSRSVDSRGSDNGPASSLGHEATAFSSSSASSTPVAAPTAAPRPKAKLPVVTAVTLEALLAASPNADATCAPGVEVGVYNSDMSQHYAIPSEHVQITRGAIKYVDHHARYGAQTRFRFQLCHNFLLRKCPKLSECSYIHATQLPAPTQVHLNPFAPRRSSANRQVASATHDDPTVAHTYPTLPTGLFVPVFPPLRAPRDASAGDEPDRVSANAAVVVVPSEQLIVTAGAEELIRMLDDLPEHPIGLALKSSPSAAASVMETLPPAVLERARHCAHYQFKRLCNLGAGCQYIHSKVPLLTTAKAQQLHNQHYNPHQQLPSESSYHPHHQYQPGMILQQGPVDAAAFAAGMNAALSTGAFPPGMQIPPPAFASVMAPPPAAGSTAASPSHFAPPPFPPPQATSFAGSQGAARQQASASSAAGPPPYSQWAYTPSYNTPGFPQPQQQFPPTPFHAQMPPHPPPQPFYPDPQYRTSGPRPPHHQVQPTANYSTPGQPQGSAPAVPSGYFSSTY